MTAGAAWARACASSLFAFSLFLAGIPGGSLGEGTRGDPVMLEVGGLYDTPELNPLWLRDYEVWTHDVLDRVYDSVGKSLPANDALAPYLLKGIDANDNGLFDASEYGVFWKKEGGDILNVTAYYDFNGVYFHDGEQATAGDLFFSYQLRAMSPRTRLGVEILMDKGGGTGSNYSSSRRLFMAPAKKFWEFEPSAGNSSLRFAVRFSLQEPYARFYNETLAGQILYPRHVWEGTGWRTDVLTGAKVSPLHADFGIAIYPESDSRFGQGVPTTETTYKPYQYINSATPAVDSAEEWEPEDDDVIGTGPFEFERWIPEREMGLYPGEAWVGKNALYYTGVDKKTGEMVDASVTATISGPYVDRIHFYRGGNAAICSGLVKSAWIDICRWSIPPEYEIQLVPDHNIRIWTRPDPGFLYLAYDMRIPLAGFWHWGQPDQFDIGYHFRKAISHMLDKNSMVRDILQGYGVPGVVPLSPANTLHYNAFLVPYEYNETLAVAEISLAHQDALWLLAHGGPPDATTWFTYDSGGKLVLPGAGTSQFSLYCPYHEIDVQWVNTCSMYIVPALRKLGVQASQRPFHFGRYGLTQPPPPMEMYVWDWRVSGDDPGYLYEMFHSSNAPAGQNYIGFNDPTMDSVLDAARREMNVTRRAQLFRWAQSILLDKLPYETLFFRTNIEITNQGRFVGWLPVHGTIWNYWSLMNIRPPSNARIRVGVEAPSAMASGSAETIEVEVKDWNDEPVDGAKVTMTIEPPWAGNFSIGGGTPAKEVTAIASLGHLQARFFAPRVEHPIDVTITANAVIPGHPEVLEESRSFVITVYPADEQFLAVKVTFLDSDIVATSNSIRFSVEVTDSQGFPVYDAQVNASMDIVLPPPYGIQPREGNAAEMGELTFVAPRSDLLKDDETLFVLTVNASAPGIVGGSSRVGFVVVKSYATCPTGARLPNDIKCPHQENTTLPAIAASLIGFAVLAVLAVFVLHRRRMA